MTKTGSGSQRCPRCKLIAPATATVCDCGYDLRLSPEDQPGQMLEKPDAPRSKIRGIGLFMLCVAAAAATAFWTRGIPDFIGGTGLLRGTAEYLLAWAAVALCCAVGLILLLMSFARRRER